MITTMVDLFRFPSQSSVLEEEKALKTCHEIAKANDRIEGFEKILSSVVQKIRPYKFFIPYIQKHEFEALLFCNANVFVVESEKIRDSIVSVLNEIPNPEDINTTESGHPARRITDIFASDNRRYNKGADAVDFAELIGIDIILEKCPLFRTWIESLKLIAQTEML